MQTHKDIEGAIVGGGIAGLSTAVACHQAGLDAHVFEAAPEFKALGTSLSRWPSAMACFADWGLAPQIRKRGQTIEQLAWRHLDGRAIFQQPLSDLKQRFQCGTAFPAPSQQGLNA